MAQSRGQREGVITMFTSVLVPVDVESPESAVPALEAGLRLARDSGAAVTVLSVVSSWPEDLARVDDELAPELEAFADRHRGGARVDTAIRVGGAVAARILDAVAELGVDLVAMASHDPVMSDYLIGSNARHVALHAPCSVLVVRGQGAVEPKRILVPVDPAQPETAETALGLAGRIAAETGAALTLLAVLPVAAEDSPDDVEAARARIAEMAQAQSGAEVIWRSAASPSGEIRAVAAEAGFDLVVMASHDPRPGDYLIGSNAAYVVLHTPCSVLVVR